MQSRASLFRIILSALMATGVLAPGSRARAQKTVPVDMASGWIRRDWDKCRDPSRMRQGNRSITIETDTSAALYWQIPTRSGQPMKIDRNQGWIRECDRPPADFDRQIQKQDRNGDQLLDASEYRYVTWRWRVDNTIDDRATIDSNGKIQREGDDFAAKLGISILKKGSDDLREISYIWTRTLPEETVIVHEKRVLFWSFQYHRIVAESGEAAVNTWVPEVRNLYADYKRIYPNEEPGRIVRIYVMTDSDNTRDRVTGSFAEIEFHKRHPSGYAEK